MERKCKQCGDRFEADEEWKTICLDCWKANRNRRDQQLMEQLERRTRELEAEVDRYQRQSSKQQLEISRLELLLISERGKELPRHNSQPIPPDMIRRLLQLAHPDKHGGSEAATKATQWLLGQRGS